MTDVLTKEQRHRNMAAIRSRHTGPERAVRSLVRAQGYRYRLHQSNLPGKPDIVFASRKKVIFVNGCFWHMHSCKYGLVKPGTNASFWELKRKLNKKRDSKNLKLLHKKGWKSLVVWGCDLKNPALVSHRISTFLATGR